MAKGEKGGLAVLFGKPDDDGEAAPEDTGYADDEKAGLFKSALGREPKEGELEAFKELVHACMEE